MPKSPPDYESMSRFFSLLGDQTRLRILFFLAEKESAVTDIVRASGRAQPTVSLCLRLLEAEGLVKKRRDGRAVYYSLKSRLAEKALRWMEIESGNKPKNRQEKKNQAKRGVQR